MAPWSDETSHSSEEIVRRTPRWLAGVAILVVGIAVGAVGSRLGTSDGRNPSVDGAAVVGCGAEKTLVLDVADLPPGSYELRASVGDRMLPMINSMTYPIVGTHRGHQSLVPHDGRLLLAADVPVGTSNPLRYELVDDGSGQVVGGTIRAEQCDDMSARSTTSTPTPLPPIETRTFSEFLVETDLGGFVFERVDRSTPEPIEASEGQDCFADPGWASDGAPFERGESLTRLPSGADLGTVNVMGQCTLDSDG